MFDSPLKMCQTIPMKQKRTNTKTKIRFKNLLRRAFKGSVFLSFLFLTSIVFGVDVNSVLQADGIKEITEITSGIYTTDTGGRIVSYNGGYFYYPGGNGSSIKIPDDSPIVSAIQNKGTSNIATVNWGSTSSPVGNSITIGGQKYDVVSEAPLYNKPGKFDGFVLKSEDGNYLLGTKGTDGEWETGIGLRKSGSDYFTDVKGDSQSVITGKPAGTSGATASQTVSPDVKEITKNGYIEVGDGEYLATTDNGSQWISTDGGKSWSPYNASSPAGASSGVDVQEITKNGYTEIGNGEYLATTDNGSQWISTDGGKSWSPYNASSPAETGYSFDAGGNALVDSNGNVIAQKGEDGLFRTADGKVYKDVDGRVTRVVEKPATSPTTPTTKGGDFSNARLGNGKISSITPRENGGYNIKTADGKQVSIDYDPKTDTYTGPDGSKIEATGKEFRGHLLDKGAKMSDVYNSNNSKVVDGKVYDKADIGADGKPVTGAEKVGDVDPKTGEVKYTDGSTGNAAKTAQVKTVITQNIIQYVILIMEAKEGGKTKDISKDVKVKAQAMQKSQGKPSPGASSGQSSSDLYSLPNTPIEATTISGAAAAMIQLLRTATIDLSLLSEEVADPQDEPKEKQTGVDIADDTQGKTIGDVTSGGSHDASSDTPEKTQNPTTPTEGFSEQVDFDEADPLTTYKREEIRRRRLLLMAEWAVAATNIGEGSNAISEQFYGRAQLFISAANGAEGSLGGASAINDTDRFVLFELTRGAALSAVQLGLSGSMILNELETVGDGTLGL